MRPNPELPRLAAAIRRISAKPWSGVAYRSASPAYAGSRDLVSGEGVRRHGGRWNPPGAFAAVYASLSPETALAEALAQFRHYGIPEADALPRVIAALEVRLEALSDLTAGSAPRTLRVSRRRMRNDAWRRAQGEGRESLTQAIGRAAFEAGLEALLVPSAADPSGTNLVVFPARLAPGSRLAVRAPASRPH
ncbi:MAG: RES family NAD+ phosphorylase [Acidobacteriota bacterium]